jgi:hypothetical protein
MAYNYIGAFQETDIDDSESDMGAYNCRLLTGPNKTAHLLYKEGFKPVDSKGTWCIGGPESKHCVQYDNVQAKYDGWSLVCGKSFSTLADRGKTVNDNVCVVGATPEEAFRQCQMQQPYWGGYS